MSNKEIHLWSDGSSINHGKGQGLGGHGYVLLYGDFSGKDLHTEYGGKTLTGYSYATETTNQREEMKAVIEGLKRITDVSVPVQIFSDSAYLVNGMNQRWFDGWRRNGWKNSKKEPVANRDLWEELLNIIESNMMFVKFNKVKGHAGIFYNELADDLAGKGLEEARGVVS